MTDAIGDRDLKRTPLIRLNFIDSSISSYFYIINSLGLFDQIMQTNKLASVLCDLNSDRMRKNEDKNKRTSDSAENRGRKSEEKKVREK